MARKADGKGKVRADYEAAILALVEDWQEVYPLMRLRLNQAMRRHPELQSLLEPALEDLKRMSHGVMDAQAQVSAAIVKLMER